MSQKNRTTQKRSKALLVLPLCLGAVMAFTLAGCSKNSASTDPSASGAGNDSQYTASPNGSVDGNGAQSTTSPVPDGTHPLPDNGSSTTAPNHGGTGSTGVAGDSALGDAAQGVGDAVGDTARGVGNAVGDLTNGARNDIDHMR